MFSPLLNTEFIGKRLIYLPQCHSTNDFAIECCKKERVENGTIFITSNQTAGKGQRGNKWLSEAEKNLTFSIVLDAETISLESIFKRNMLVSCAIVDFLNCFQTGLKIKWPNDIYYEKKKMGGILIETISDVNRNPILIIGIGLNINQIEFNYLNATSLINITKKQYDLPLVLENLIKNTESFLKLCALDSEKIIENLYLKTLYQFDVLALYKTEEETFEGKIKTIKNDGRIGIEKNAKLFYFERKQVVFLN